MINGKQIKIVKRATRHETQTALSEKTKSSARNSGAAAKREAVTIVTGWVRELRQKKVAETTHGFESLFRKAA